MDLNFGFFIYTFIYIKKTQIFKLMFATVRMYVIYKFIKISSKFSLYAITRGHNYNCLFL